DAHAPPPCRIRRFGSARPARRVLPAGGSLRRAALVRRAAAAAVAHLQLAAAPALLRHRHLDFQDAVAERCGGLLDVDAFGQRYRAVEAAVRALAVVVTLLV